MEKILENVGREKNKVRGQLLEERSKLKKAKNKLSKCIIWKAWVKRGG